MLIGAHVSAAGGVEKSVKRALDIDAECIPDICIFSPHVEVQAHSGGERVEIPRGGVPRPLWAPPCCMPVTWSRSALPTRRWSSEASSR